MFLPLFQGRGKDGDSEPETEWPSELPLLPLRNVVAFPYAVLPLAVGQPRSVRLLESVLEGDGYLVDPTVEEPGPDGIYQVGTVAKIERALRGDDGQYQIVARSVARVRVEEWVGLEPYLKVRVESLVETSGNPEEIEALRAMVRSAAGR